MVDDTNHTSDVSDIDRRMFLKSSAVATVPLWMSSAAAGDQFTSEQISSLVDEMELAEKVRQVTGQKAFDVETGYIPPNDRLGIPDVRMSDGPLGLRRGPQTAFPATISLASSFSRELVYDEGAAIARESRANDQDVHLAPAMNIVRVPQLGRAFEYFGEDPEVTGTLATAFTEGIQAEDVIATAKHFAANNQEVNRGGPTQDLPGVSAEVSERALREIYLAGFKQVVKEGNVGAIMAAYNRINGTYATEHGWLLEDILKGEWGFDGFVVSDWGAVHSTVATATNGLDVEMPGEDPAFDLGPAYWGDDLVKAVRDRKVSTATINEKVQRLLGQLERFGRFDQDDSETTVDYEANRALAQEVAENGAVLLKNEDEALPLDESEINDLALIGSTPDRFRIGGGGSSDVVPQRRIGPVKGLESVVGDSVTINAVETDDHQPLATEYVSPPNSDQTGFQATYYDNERLEGEPVLTRTEQGNALFVDTIESIDGISSDGFSTRWTGKLTAPVTGTVSFELTSSSTTRLSIDGEEVIENSGSLLASSTSSTATVKFERGQTYDIEIEIIGTQHTDEPYLRIGWDRPDVNPMELALDAAESADAAVVLAKGSSREGTDRDDLELDNNQNELIKRVSETNDNTTVLLNTGGPVVMPWVDDVPSILEMWFPGQEGGTAAANLLFGHTNPSGRLPLTFGQSLYDYPANNPDSDRQYPGVNNEVYYDEGVFVGYRYFDRQEIEPLFPFGHGESYTEFEYSSLRVTPKVRNRDKETVKAEVQVQNTGNRTGAETVQLYVYDVEASIERPPKELKAFDQVSLLPGEKTTVEFELDDSAFEFFHPDEGWTVETGKFDILVGSSSRDIRLKDDLKVIDPSAEEKRRN